MHTRQHTHVHTPSLALPSGVMLITLSLDAHGSYFWPDRSGFLFCPEPRVSSPGPQRLALTAPLASRAAPRQAVPLPTGHGGWFVPDRPTAGLPARTGCCSWGPSPSACNTQGPEVWSLGSSTLKGPLGAAEGDLSHYRRAEPIVLNLFVQSGFRNQLGSWGTPSLFIPARVP